MISEELFTTLAARKLAGEATAEEQQELDAMLQQHAVLRERYLILQQYFTESAYHNTSDTEQALTRTLSRIHASGNDIPVKRIRFTAVWKWAGVAAAVLLIAGIGFTYRFTTTVKQEALADTAQWLNRQNGKATKAIIELADGSKIWLNADSKLTYPEVFNNNIREVYLEGEAFFDVASNPERPFIIHLAKGNVQVLGTSFNIRAYNNEPIQTSVKTGKVAFIPAYDGSGKKPDTIYITPDEKVIYELKSESIKKEATYAEDDKAWTEGRLVFRNMTLEEISFELERAFGKKVTFMEDAPRHYRLTGNFQNNNLQDIMYYLARSKAFHYDITDSTLVISQ
ncbi:FecR family protein [Chitinophaga sp. CF118]|uniref:FecR domain-containing protein n=1 Tax=Chitinophaga sp. CF118 TaxID=1884367 RepID=UPI0008F1042B|nr:FecR domain-containing protein [Chitinophaga sp. CF118]SFE80562.1 FecR family protein [Chitinophaga sp. CF118]